MIGENSDGVDNKAVNEGKKTWLKENMSLTKLNFFSSTHRHVMDVGVSYVTHLFKTVYFFLCFFLFSSLEFYVKTTKLITLDFCTGISKKIMSFFSLETS